METGCADSKSNCCEMCPLAQVLRRGECPPADQNTPADYAEWGWFSRMAGLLLRESTLVVDSAHFDIVEVEAYLWCEGHEDPYVHRDPQQTNTCGAWYFHREKAAKIGFTLKGLDLTFGEPGEEAGGLLIRAIMNQATGEFIEGPSKVVDMILRTTVVTCVAELKQKMSGLQIFRNNAFDARGILHIEPKAAMQCCQVRHIKAGPRVGLSEKDPYFRQAPYRFHARPEWAKKDRARIVAGVPVLAPPAPPKPKTSGAELGSDESQLIEAYINELLGV